MTWWFLFRLTTWRVYLNPWELAGVLAFSLVLTFTESILVFCVPVILGLCLPRSWFREVFVARGGMLAATGLIYMMFLDDQLKHEMLFPTLPIQPWLLVLPLVAVPVMVFAAGRMASLRRIVESFADRATIFLYLLMPLTAISVFVIGARWVIGASKP